MSTALGPFKAIPPAGGFKAVLTPKVSPGTLRISVQKLFATGTFTVDWGNGSPVSYSLGTTPATTPTGTITVKCDVDGLEFDVLDNQITTCTITGGGLVRTLSLNALSLLTSFSMDNGTGLNSLASTFFNCSGLTSISFTNPDLTGVSSLSQVCRGCSSLTSFPLLTFDSSLTNMSRAFQDSGLTSFPLIATGSVTNFFNCWDNAALTSFPLIDTSSGTDFESAWENNEFTSFPGIDLSAATTLENAFSSCDSMTSFTPTDFGSCTNFVGMFSACNSLISLGNLKTEAGEQFSGMFSGCTDLETIGAIDTTSTTSTSTNMFAGCTSLTSPNASQQTDLADSDGANFN